MIALMLAMANRYDADHVTIYFGSGDGSTESEGGHISGTDHLPSVTVSQLIVRSYQEAEHVSPAAHRRAFEHCSFK
jgi:hypothetical protein